MKNVKKVSSGFFDGSIAGGLLLGVMLVFIGAFTSSVSPADPTPAVLLAAGVLLLVYADIVFLVLLYKAWGCIQDGVTRTKPGQAIGFLFIPIFNWYWVFRAIPGFADEYNSYLERTNLPVRRLTKGAFQALAVLSVLTLIPIIGAIAALAALFVVCGVADKLCLAVNALAEATPNFVSGASGR
ncbi:MAG: hypothetical protein U0Z53_20190 [Blastocatellia bacterium]